MEKYMIQGRHCAYNIALRHVGVTIVAVEKQYLSITFSECVFVALVIQYASNVCLKHVSF